METVAAFGLILLAVAGSIVYTILREFKTPPDGFEDDDDWPSQYR